MKISKGSLLIVALFAIGSVNASEKRKQSSSRASSGSKGKRSLSKEEEIKHFISKVCLKYSDEAICRKGFVTDKKGNVKVTSCRELESIANRIAVKYPYDINLTVPMLRNEINQHWYTGSNRDVKAMQKFAEETLRTYSEYEQQVGHV